MVSYATVFIILCLEMCESKGVCSRKAKVRLPAGPFEFIQYYCCDNHERKVNRCLECPSGFISNNERPCEACPTGTYGDKCVDTCVCNHEQICDKTKGCIAMDPTDVTTFRNINELPGNGTTGNSSFPTVESSKNVEATATLTTNNIDTDFYNEHFTSNAIVIAIPTSALTFLLVIVAITIFVIRRKNLNFNKTKQSEILEIDVYDEIQDDEPFQSSDAANAAQKTLVHDEVLSPATDSSTYLTPCRSSDSVSNKSALSGYQIVSQTVSTDINSLKQPLDPNHTANNDKEVAYLELEVEGANCIKTVSCDDSITNHGKSDLSCERKRFFTM